MQNTRLIAVFTSMLAVGAVSAAGVDAPADVDSPDSAMFTVNDIYNRLTSGAPGDKRGSGFSEPATETPDIKTLNDVMEQAPIEDEAAASPADVKAGKTFWSLRLDSWGTRTGTSTSINP